MRFVVMATVLLGATACWGDASQSSGSTTPETPESGAVATTAEAPGSDAVGTATDALATFPTSTVRDRAAVLAEQAEYRNNADIAALLWLANHEDDLTRLGEAAVLIDIAASADVTTIDPISLSGEWLRYYETPGALAREAADIAAGYELLALAYAADPIIADLRSFDGSEWEWIRIWLDSCGTGYRWVADSIERALGSQSFSDDWIFLIEGFQDVADCDRWRASYGID